MVLAKIRGEEALHTAHLSGLKWRREIWVEKEL